MIHAHVAPSQLRQLQVLNKLVRAGTLSRDAAKQQKKRWWANVRRDLGLSSQARLKIGLSSGTIKDARTGQVICSYS